ncbi:MAG TPA: FHA domain-containing protein, partial [Gaiellaceae bacterium]|nr:FHA domain-containing protein [Gaiellaceae bacterium]
LEREWTRIGRSLAADVRFDDPTVSRRHALIVRQADGVRVLDDRSLNGVFVNGERVEWRVLTDGDEIVVGRYRLHFLEVAPSALDTDRAPLEREWTRVGRSLAADVRFDDPTVSRRHALIVRQADGVRVLDDRSLNGVFVNGERVEWRVLSDGDEIVVGRYRLHFLEAVEEELRRRRAEPVEAAG